MKLPQEARDIAKQEIDRLRSLPYEDLKRFLKAEASEVTGQSGTTFQLEVQAVWEGREKRNLRVMVTIDDGRGFRFVMTPAEEFIITPEGTFVDE